MTREEFSGIIAELTATELTTDGLTGIMTSWVEAVNGLFDALDAAEAANLQMANDLASTQELNRQLTAQVAASITPEPEPTNDPEPEPIEIDDLIDDLMEIVR